MTTFYLVRHAVHPLIEKVLVGRMDGVSLDLRGYEQAGRIAARLAREDIDAVQSSPQKRARQTAAPIAEAAGVPLEIVSAFDEVNLGEWTGKPFSALKDDPRWKEWNEHRGRARPPAGESMQELQRRVVNYLRALVRERPNGRIAIVSHAEPIRAAMMHAIGLPLDEFWKFKIKPGSVSILKADPTGMDLLALNQAVAA
ncbi:MAG TPA: histidine phosphatase family protein [Xanthobacteraceae bacterium]|nr:histidine phosphatase family protein [Xanthobacteraceae bacterium]